MNMIFQRRYWLDVQKFWVLCFAYILIIQSYWVRLKKIQSIGVYFELLSHNTDCASASAKWLCNEGYEGCKWVLSQVLCVIYMKALLPFHSREKYPGRSNSFCLLFHHTTVSLEARPNSHALSVALSRQLVVFAPAIFSGPDNGIDNGNRSDFVLYATKGLNTATYFATKLCSSNRSLNYQMPSPSNTSAFLHCSNINAYNKTFLSSSKWLSPSCFSVLISHVILFTY